MHRCLRRTSGTLWSRKHLIRRFINQPGEGNLPTILKEHEIRFPLYTQSKEHGHHKQDPPKVLFQDRPQGCNLRSHRDKFRLTKISIRFQRKLEIVKGGHRSSLYHFRNLTKKITPSPTCGYSSPCHAPGQWKSCPCKMV